MKRQIKIIMFLIAILMLLQPLMATISSAVETEETIIQEGTATIITISDDALYEALKKAKSIQGKADFYIDENKKNTIKIEKTDLNSIKELVLEDSKISDLSGIEAFKELTYLDLSGNKLTKNSSLNKINELTKLTYLDLSRNKIEDVTAISSLLNKSGLDLDLDQDVKTVGFVSIISDPEEYEDAENILLNEVREEVELPQILKAYENMDIKIEEIKEDGKKINSQYYSKSIEIKDGKLKILNRDVNKIEVKLTLEGDLPTNGTIATIKVYRINTENQEGIYFKDENFYEAIKEKYEYAMGIKTKDFIHKNYKEWNSYTFSGVTGEEWTFDDEDLIIIANKKELNQIETITIEGLRLEDLTGLEKFIGVTYLVLNDDEIMNVSKIKELNDNKKLATEEFKSKYKKLIEKLSEQVSTYNTYEDQIKTIEKEKEDLRKAIANGSELTDDETIDEKDEKIKNIKEKQKNASSNIKSYIGKIEELCGNKTLAELLTSPSIVKEIKEYSTKKDEINSDIHSQIDAIQNNKLSDMASRINTILNNITEEEINKLVSVTLGGNAVITSAQKEKAEAKVAIKHMQDHIDTVLDTNLDSVISKINTLTKSSIKKTDSSGKDREISAIKSDLKSALNRYYDSKNGITASSVISTCKTITGITEEELLIKAKDTIIPIIQANISSYAEKANEKVNEDLRKIVIENAWNLKVASNKLRTVIDDLENYMNEFNAVLEKLTVALNTKKYLSNEDDLMRIITRLQNLAEEDMNTIIKLPDFTHLMLERNSIKNIAELTEIDTLEVLELGYNLIEELDFSKLANIKNLYLNDNCLSNITISEMKNIELLDLSDNWISNVDNISLNGMPKLSELHLAGNKIQDVDSLLKSTNSYIKGLGYDNLGKYISAGEPNFEIAEQIIDINLTINTTSTQVEVELPKIFKQIKSLQSANFTVNYEHENPCLAIYNDGTKAIIDTSEKNIQKQAIAKLTTSSGETTLFRINYIAVKDETAPTIEKITITPDKWTNEDVKLTIEAAKDEGSGLAARAYSFDSGATWQTSNEKVYTENTANIIVKVKDVAGNIYTHTPINITNIDKTKPVITVNSKVIDNETGKVSVTISIKEEDSKLSAENKYEYYLSTSKEKEEGGNWVTYTPDTAFELGENKEGTYYLFVKSVKDNVNNESEALATTEFTFKKVDKVAPTIEKVTGITDVETKENVTLTIEGAKDDVALDDEPYSFDGGLTWQASNSKTYESNTKDIQIIVRDAAGNKYVHEKLNITNIKKEETKPNEEKPEYLTLNGITKIVYAYINDDYSNLSEASKELAGKDGKFSLSEVTALIRLYLSI